MTLILKNTDTVTHDWGGVDISASAQRTLEQIDFVRLLMDGVFLSDLASGKVVINNGTDDLTEPQAKRALGSTILVQLNGVDTVEPINTINVIGEAGSVVNKGNSVVEVNPRSLNGGFFFDTIGFGSHSSKFADAFLDTGIHNHPSLETSPIAFADGFVRHVSISTGQNPERNWFLQIVKNAQIGLGPDENQLITFVGGVPDAGSWAINLGGEITSLIPAGSSASAVKSAIVALPSFTDLSVTGDETVGFTLLWDKSSHSGTDIIEPIIVNNTLTLLSNTVVPTPKTVVNGGPLGGGFQIGADLEKPAGQLDKLYTNLSAFPFLKGDRIQAYVKRGTLGSGTDLGTATKPVIRLILEYTGVI